MESHTEIVHKKKHSSVNYGISISLSLINLLIALQTDRAPKNITEFKLYHRQDNHM